MKNNIEHETQNSTETRQPHEALFLTLTYLPLLELLSMSETCTSMREAVLNDVLPWIHIKVDCVLGYRLSDQILIKYASKANGRLRSLVMIKCVKITDDGLQQVIEQNPFISKLHVAGCSGLTPDGIVTIVKALSNHGPYLTSLKINGLYNINRHQHLETLRSILTANLKNTNHFTSSNCERNDAPIDVDLCPICNQVRQVFSCSKEDCTRKNNFSVSDYCRGCSYCIARCVDCGKCVDEVEEVEAACEDILCLECWLKLPKCNTCNKPYCNQHVGLGHSRAASQGFVCYRCVTKCSWTASFD